MPCVFCGYPKTSNEHVIPLWLGKVLRETPTGLPKYGDRVDLGDFVQSFTEPGEEEPARQWTTVDPDFKVNAVCATECNNGWMERMEDRTQPYLRRMVRGRKTTLWVKGREAVSAWAFKTWLMFEQMEPADRRAAPDHLYPGFYRDRRPPPGVRIWLGAARYNLGAWQRSTRLKAARPDAETDYIYAATMNIGHLVFQIFGSSAQGRDTRRLVGRMETLLTEVWPVEAVVEWPPPGGRIAPADLAELSEEWTQAFLGPPPE